MKKRFTEAQIVGFPREADAGLPVKDLCRRNHDGRAPYTGRIVEGNRVVGRVPGNPRDVGDDGLDQLDARRRVIDRRLCERVRDDHTGVINTHMEFLPPARATASMFRSRPFTLASNR